MKIYILRHGESVANAESRLPTRDTPLTEKGQFHAHGSAEYLAGKGVEVVFTSPLRRALQTAQIIAGELACPLVQSWNLRDMGYGRVAGRELWDTTARYVLGQIDSHNPGYRVPGGGSFQGLQRRSGRALKRILNSGRHVVASVAHVETNRLLIAQLHGLALEESASIWQPHELIYFYDTDMRSVRYMVDGHVHEGFYEW